MSGFNIQMVTAAGQFTVQEDRLSDAIIGVEALMREHNIEDALVKIDPLPSQGICMHMAWYIQTVIDDIKLGKGSEINKPIDIYAIAKYPVRNTNG